MDAQEALRTATEGTQVAKALSQFCNEPFDRFLLSLCDIVAECASRSDEESSEKAALTAARLVAVRDALFASVGHSPRDMFSINIGKALTGGIVALMARTKAPAPWGSDEEHLLLHAAHSSAPRAPSPRALSPASSRSPPLRTPKEEEDKVTVPLTSQSCTEMSGHSRCSEDRACASSHAASCAQAKPTTSPPIPSSSHELFSTIQGSSVNRVPKSEEGTMDNVSTTSGILAEFDFGKNIAPLTPSGSRLQEEQARQRRLVEKHLAAQKSTRKRRPRRIDRCAGTCAICGARFQKVMEHIRNVHKDVRIEPGAQILACSVDGCDRRFATVQQQHHHVAVDHNIPDSSDGYNCDSRRTCEYCSKTFVSAFSLRIHARQVHPESYDRTNSFSCPVRECSLRFHSALSLSKHIKALHGGSVWTGSIPP